jgi:hypothetical protein
MKLADLRKKLRHSKRFGRPVDELDEFLMEKGAMERPDPVDVSAPIKGRTHDMVIIDDPIKGDVTGKRADFRREVLGEWVKEPEHLGDLPPTLQSLLDSEAVSWDNTKPERIAGQILYDRRKGDLAEVKGPITGADKMAGVWYGERMPSGQPVIRAVPLEQLYAIKTAACTYCRGHGGAGRRGGLPPCPRCNGLKRVPVRGSTAPFKDDRHEDDR